MPPFTTASPSSAAYSAAITTIGYSNDATVTLAGLSNGLKYQVEIWNYDPADTGNGNVNTTYTSPGGTPLNITTGGSPGSLTGAFVIGTFIANGSSQTFDFQNTSSSYGILNGISVEEITSAPEPSAWALMLGGLGLLVFWRLRTFRITR